MGAVARTRRTRYGFRQRAAQRARTAAQSCSEADPASPRNLRRLIEELAALPPEERTRVMTDAVVRGFRKLRFRPPLPAWSLPVLKGGERCVGGDLRREDMYGDDGR